MGEVPGVPMRGLLQRLNHPLLLPASQLPAVAASAGLVTLMGWSLGQGRWWVTSGLVLAWLALGLVALTTSGERFMVGMMFPKWEPITDLDRRVGFPVREQVAALTGRDVNALEVYAATEMEGPNAFAVGGRTVGLTPEFLDLCQNSDVGDDEVVAVLAHELGHHGSGTRGSAALTWLCRPYDLLVLFILGVIAEMVRQHPVVTVLGGDGVGAVDLQSVVGAGGRGGVGDGLRRHSRRYRGVAARRRETRRRLRRRVGVRRRDGPLLRAVHRGGPDLVADVDVHPPDPCRADGQDPTGVIPPESPWATLVLRYFSTSRRRLARTRPVTSVTCLPL